MLSQARRCSVGSRAPRDRHEALERRGHRREHPDQAVRQQEGPKRSDILRDQAKDLAV